MTEPRLVLKIKKALQAEGHYVAKIHGGRYSAGVPDLLVCVHQPGRLGYGLFVALEVKLPGKEKNVTKLQASQIKAIRKANGHAWVVSSVEAALEVCKLLPLPKKDELIYECSG